MSTPFIIYNASAGSGKTYTLVKDYLRILLSSVQKEAYKQILAVTFTNKAVAEMKARIIENLNAFAFDETAKNSPMFVDLTSDLKLHPAQLQQKAKEVLKSILHNYAFFEVATIDKFTHSVIRTFAYDLKLPLNFEVELDTDALLNEAVDQLISKAGEDKLISEVLIEYALEKADDDKSWDIAFDLNKIAKLLLNENEKPHLRKLKDKTLEDFSALKSLLKSKIQDAEKAIVHIGEDILATINEHNLDFKSFSGGYVPKHFQKLAQGNFKVTFGSSWQEKLLQNETLYPKREENTANADAIDTIQPKLIAAFIESKEIVMLLLFLKNFYKNVTPLSVLNAIQHELEIIKEEQNLLLISEFNTLISETIKDEPAPFIYERLGEKYKHYFIDEFQDTSEMQWQNLIPLIANKLQTEATGAKSGSLTIVGDAKQSIYRWRGGKAEQFIGLNKDVNPFFVEKDPQNLPRNYRSYDEIINFNNDFFQHVASFFQQEEFRDLYKIGATQLTNDKKGGLISFDFIEAKTVEEEFEIIPKKVVTKIQEVLQKGFQHRDICVLTRRKSEGIAVADALSAHEIPIISSETLLIKRSQEVQFINDVLKLAIQPKNNEVKLHLLNYLATEKLQLPQKHQFLKKHVGLEPEKLFEALQDFTFDFTYFLQLSLYEAVEYCIRAFQLTYESDAYLQFFLDFVLEYTQKKQLGFAGFLEHWEKKKDHISIMASGSENAVQIMTIHKAKGLEFPVVIFPFANTDIYKEIEPKLWYPINAADFNGFEEAYLNLNSSIKEYGELGESLYNARRSELELDNFNILYVACTRPEQQLHIITKKDIDSKGNERLQTFSGIFINYLKTKEVWNDELSTYTFGDSEANLAEADTIADIHTITQEKFISTAKEDHNLHLMTKQGLLWDTSQEAAIEKGNLIHDVLAEIKYPSDLEFVLDEYISKGIIDAQQREKLEESISLVVNHVEIEPYFHQDNTVYNEKDIISKAGKILRPDRIVVNPNNETIIIDYKTGKHDPFYVEKIYEYGDTLAEMGFSVTKKILLYINEEIIVKYV
ncbi:ATP-dependent helicase/nuclease subunit A [Kordia sp. SMS9]|uniref:UvrD-helicase domain-containing protein n=1 Tax=Kordia sp. SMS9 TaxID=2282170 RepID=UPI000E0D919F|nr:UvrD-helicase domain-containing protein [Kordia sp. SMS9]AXG68786.1 ATP-dependent helicase/nuclease subunit A [Kordia sp. SMS9]